MLTLKGLASLGAGVILAMIFLCAAQAAAQPVTYVSGKGTDKGDCSSPANPCRTFQYAVNQTASGGEVKALDPANYSPVTINKSITITGVDGAGIDTNGGTAISIATAIPTRLVIRLDRLILQNVSGSSTTGIFIGNPMDWEGTLWVAHCNIEGYSTGIAVFRATLVATDTAISRNNTGISVLRAGATLDHVLLSGNKTSGVAAGLASLTVVDTTATGNGDGFTIGSTVSSFARSTITANTVGIDFGSPPGPGNAISFGNNHIKGNVTDVKGGTLTNVGTQ